MKYVYVFILVFTIFSASAQYSEYAKKIIFKKENGNAVRAFKLPLKMICTFNNGSSHHLILENIINDTLIFKKYYNQQNFDCTINSISWIDVRSPQKIVQNTLFSVSVIATSFFASLTVAGILTYNPHIEGSEVPLLAAIFFGMPATILSSVGIIANTNATPFVFDTSKWKLYVK